jgi:hypothetical protein
MNNRRIYNVKTVLLYTSRRSHPRFASLLAESFRSAGCQVTWLNDENDNIVLPEYGRDSRFDLFFTMACNSWLDLPHRLLKKMARRTAVWITGGGAYGLNREYSAYVHDFDVVLANSRFYFTGAQRQKMGKKFHLLQLGYAPLEQKPVKSVERSHKLSFVGTIYPPRLEFLSRFYGMGLRVWAPQWTEKTTAFYPQLDFTYHGKANPGEMAQIMSNSLLTVNPVFYPDYINMRVLECGFSGIVQICEQSEGLQSAGLSDGSELLLFRSKRELQQKVGKYLSEPELVFAMEEKMPAFFARHHLLSDRVNDALRTISL